MSQFEKFVIYGFVAIFVVLFIVNFLDKFYCLVYKIKRKNTSTEDGNYD